MAGNLITLDVRTRKQWRQWLAAHHASSSGIWLVRYKQHSAVKAMRYEDVVVRREPLPPLFPCSHIERDQISRHRDHHVEQMASVLRHHFLS